MEVWGPERRGIEEPPTESLVRGSREGFSESFRTNTSLLRLRAPGEP
ncbi:spore germination protein [Moorellaceae bacterium AZ2]